MSTKTSTITVSITRTLNTAQYENMQLQVSTTEQITWDTLEERGTKVDKVAALLTKEYQRTQTSVLSEIGVAEKRAWMKDSKPAPRGGGDIL